MEFYYYSPSETFVVLTAETSAFESLRWLIYIVNSVDKTKLSGNTPSDAAQQFLWKLTPFIMIGVLVVWLVP